MMSKIKTGIEGLDALISGGFPQGRTCLIAGEPGTGKTTLCMQFLLEGVATGQKGVYITIDEKPEHLVADAKALGWDIQPYLEKGLLQILDVTHYFTPSKLGQMEGIDSEKIITEIMAFIQKSQAIRVAVDPIAPLVFASKTASQVVEYIRQLVFTLEAAQSYTTLLTSYVPVGSEKISLHGIEEFAVSGIIVLRLVNLNHKFVRTIRVRKMRGTRVDLSEYSFEILPNRGLVLRQPV